MWLPSTGLSISEVFNRIIYVLDKNEVNAVFVIDEIDYLAELIQKTGKDVLYQITRANERLTTGSLTLIGVSNDLTFKERLDPRVISTLSEEEVIFTNYNLPQIKEILDARIEVAFEEGIVSDAALNLCSAMAGRESGDARRALDPPTSCSRNCRKKPGTNCNRRAYQNGSRKDRGKQRGGSTSLIPTT